MVWFEQQLIPFMRCVRNHRLLDNEIGSTPESLPLTGSRPAEAELGVILSPTKRTFFGPLSAGRLFLEEKFGTSQLANPAADRHRPIIKAGGLAKQLVFCKLNF